MGEGYLNRCIRRLESWNAPLSGWECESISDVKEDDFDAPLACCDLCGCSQVRYVHSMRHPQYFEPVDVGCECAGVMEGNELAARDRDRRMKNRAKRKRNYLKRRWKTSYNGNQTLWYKRQWITIVEANGGFSVIADGGKAWRYRGKRITDFRTAVYVAFDLVDPPIGGGSV